MVGYSKAASTGAQSSARAGGARRAPGAAQTILKTAKNRPPTPTRSGPKLKSKAKAKPKASPEAPPSRATFASRAELHCRCRACGRGPRCEAHEYAPVCTSCHHATEYWHEHMNARGEVIDPTCRCEACDGDAYPECTTAGGEACPRCVRTSPEGDERHVCICEECEGTCKAPDGKGPCGDCVFLDGTHVDHRERWCPQP